MISLRIGAPLAACFTLLCAAPVQAQQSAMTFFVSSVSVGRGADLGGLPGPTSIARTLPPQSARAARHGTLICRRKAQAR